MSIGYCVAGFPQNPQVKQLKGETAFGSKLGVSGHDSDTLRLAGGLGRLGEQDIFLKGK